MLFFAISFTGFVVDDLRILFLVLDLIVNGSLVGVLFVLVASFILVTAVIIECFPVYLYSGFICVQCVGLLSLVLNVLVYCVLICCP